jgi:hypothetical protein
VRVWMEEMAPGNSGARVTSLMGEGDSILSDP